MKNLLLDGNSLTLEDVAIVASCPLINIRLSPEAERKVEKCRAYVERIIAEKRIVYGLTTGFGKFANINISKKDVDKLQENLIVSHAISVGQPYDITQTRAIMLLRANVLAKGYSGIRASTLKNLIQMINKGVHPIIPRQGSVGASGDLSPLSHLALVLIGKGRAEYQGIIMEGKTAMHKAGLKPLTLSAKEGLALNNGTQVMTGIGTLLLLQSEHLARAADVIAALTIDAMKGTPSAFDPLLHRTRPHSGQITSASNIFKLLKYSKLRESHRHCLYVQDPYSLRCTPQVHGAVRDALDYVRRILEVEINSATDNPLIFPDQDKVISGGNFHGEPVAMAMDTLGMAMSELASVSERRTEQLLNPSLNRDLPPFLAARPGLDSGFMIAQLTAAALVSENKVLAHPACVDSIPTSANQEDHVSMGSISANKAIQIITNVSNVLAIELMIAIQALDCRNLASSPALEIIRTRIRKKVRPLEHDRELSQDLEWIKQWLDSEEITQLIESKVRIK